ncbi:hypothetical protein J6590_012803 [Homalodisca vitripennis]|nr:hypothetical protein J6590_012803 [Homalodisca vitripennis]
MELLKGETQVKITFSASYTRVSDIYDSIRASLRHGNTPGMFGTYTCGLSSAEYKHIHYIRIQPTVQKSTRRVTQTKQKPKGGVVTSVRHSFISQALRLSLQYVTGIERVFGVMNKCINRIGRVQFLARPEVTIRDTICHPLPEIRHSGFSKSPAVANGVIFKPRMIVAAQVVRLHSPVGTLSSRPSRRPLLNYWSASKQLLRSLSVLWQVLTAERVPYDRHLLLSADTDSDSDGGSGSVTPILRFIPPTLILPVAPSTGVRRRHSWICGVSQKTRSRVLTRRNVHHGGPPSAERKSEGSLRPRMMER